MGTGDWGDAIEEIGEYGDALEVADVCECPRATQGQHHIHAHMHFSLSNLILADPNDQHAGNRNEHEHVIGYYFIFPCIL